MPNKIIISGKIEKDKSNHRKYKIKKDKGHESDIEIEVTGDDVYEVEKLSVEGLPANMPDGHAIRWFNNFQVKKNGRPIKEKYFVTLPDGGKSRLVVMDSKGEPYYYAGNIKNNVIELTDGDPATGWVP